MNNVAKVFEKVLSKVTQVVVFDPKWKNTTGYLDGLVKADLGLEPGQMAKSVDDFGRQVIIVGTIYGNAVVFERYSPTDGERSAIFVSNLPENLRRFFGGVGGIGSALQESGIALLIGAGHYGSSNIGERFTRLTYVEVEETEESLLEAEAKTA